MSLPSVLIDADLAAFIGGRVSVLVATAGRQQQPSLVRALGCRLSTDHLEVTLFLNRRQSAPVLEHLRQSRAVAVVFSQPSTHRTVQLKGEDAEILPLSGDDAARAEAYCTCMIPELARVGMSEAFTRAFLSFDKQDLVALRFRPCAAFSQSPGPNAGSSLGGPA